MIAEGDTASASGSPPKACIVRGCAATASRHFQRMNDEVRLELIAMEKEDSLVRERLAADGSLYEGYHPEMEAVHTRNGERLAALLDQYGWIGASLAGEDGAHAAFKVLMHAIGMPALQRRCLALLQAARARGEIPGGPVAFLEDRVRVFEGRPQRYGTQFEFDADGKMTPAPIEDPEHVNERRRAIGLDTIEERTARYRAEQRPQDRPRDPVARKLEFETWLKSVGWR